MIWLDEPFEIIQWVCVSSEEMGEDLLYKGEVIATRVSGDVVWREEEMRE